MKVKTRMNETFGELRTQTIELKTTIPLKSHTIMQIENDKSQRKCE